ncbi:MAG: LysM peptidoglycan-binding domain-containing protein [Patescibacteria group bacterium]
MTSKKPVGVQGDTTESNLDSTQLLRKLELRLKNIKLNLASFETRSLHRIQRHFGRISPHLGFFIVFSFVFLSNTVTSRANSDPVQSIVLATIEEDELKNFNESIVKYSAVPGIKLDMTELSENLTQKEYFEVPQTTNTNKTAEVAVKIEPEVPKERTKDIDYTVQGGDTVSGLAKKFGLKVATIQTVNKLGASGKIKPGQKLTISAKDLTPTQIRKSTLVATASASESRVVRNNTYSGSKSVKYVSRSAGQCVPFAREYSGKPVYGVAKWIMPNSQAPAVGGVILTSESGYGHVAVVTSVNSDSVEIIERNYTSGWITKRVLPIDSRVIRGYFN